MKPVRILIVEDDPRVAEFCSECLEHLDYHVAGIVDSGEDALGEVREKGADGVLMDIHLKGKMDGVEAAERVFAHYDIPVVFMTADDTPELLERAKRVGSLGYLVKPFEKRELHVALEMALYRVAAERERREMEARLRQSQKLEALGTLAGGIAHNMNNILSLIAGYTELASLDAAKGSRQRVHLGKVIEAVTRAKKTVEQVVLFSRQEGSQRAPIEMTPIVIDAATQLRECSPTNIEIRQILKARSDRIQGNAAQVRQVVENLCTNAAMAMAPGGGVMTITLSEESPGPDEAAGYLALEAGPHLKLSVSDTGAGMNRETLARAFDPFFTTRETGEGVGLGLSVALGIVRAHGGDIRAHSESGRGSTFEVFLPRLP